MIIVLNTLNEFKPAFGVGFYYFFDDVLVEQIRSKLFRLVKKRYKEDTAASFNPLCPN